MSDNNQNQKEISIVIPALNEAESLSVLRGEIAEVMKSVTSDYEIIIIDDGSSDNTQKVISNLCDSDREHIIGICFKVNFGKATALKVGFGQAQGKIIITMDADLQDDPKEIPRFIAKINEGYDLVSGWKQNRKDSFIKNNSSKFYNFTTSLFSKIKLHDFNCGFKAYKSEIAKELDLYGQLHRYIPVMVGNRGYRITEISVHHRKRKYGRSKYGPIRFLNGFLDLLTVIILTRYFKRPAHFFGAFGFIALGTGFTIGLYITFLKFSSGSIQGKLPLLIAGILLIMVGVQLISLGLIGEMFVKISGEKKDGGSKIKRII
ncbi:MAG: glycosyltransferase [Xanthomonadaceae bacterium]|nr:glycosyltransferase [Rhodospirillaceae bacterium]NIA17625.1 glycosyltransferase [Xanthomonadaceae bacterium]